MSEEVQHPDVGKIGVMHHGQLQFRVRVTAARRITGVYESLEFRVTPEAGEGNAWVEATKVHIARSIV